MATNVSSVVSHFPDAENGFTTTTAGSVSSGATTVTLNSVSGYTNGQPVVLVIDPTDASKKQTFTGIIDTAGVQVTSVVWTAGTNQTHALGATVVDYATATHIAMISKGILVNHSQSGSHTQLTDANGNEWLKHTATASAVNEFTIINNSTGSYPILSASGGDTNIGLYIKPKGSGPIILADDSYNEVIKTGSVASAVNEITVTNAATAGLPVIEATGGDTNISVRTKAKGTGTWQNGLPISFHATTTQSVNNAASDAITTYTEVFDYGSNFDHTTGLFTAPYDGVYHFDVVMGVTDATSATGRIDVGLIIGGSQRARGHGAANSTSGDPTGNCSTTYTMTAGQTAYVQVNNNTGGAEAMSGSSFSGSLVGRTD